MQDGRGKNRNRGGAHFEGRAGSRAQEKSDGKMDRLGHAVGNEEINKRMLQGNANRDQMLALLSERLKTMRDLQLREVNLTKRGAHFTWWRDAADKQDHAKTSPEPSRWKLAAQTYEQAAESLCRGDLSRGRQLMERAMQEENQARASLTQLVDTTNIENDHTADPGALPTLTSTEVSGRCDLPDGVKLAREIQEEPASVEEMPNRKRLRDPWWTLDEEDEEEGDDAGGG